MYEGFAQDTWRVKPKMVLEYGTRYSVMQPYNAAWGNQSVFTSARLADSPAMDPITGLLTGGNPYNGVVIPGGFPSSAQGHVPADISPVQGGLHGNEPGYSTRWTDIQPRVVFTYQVSPRRSSAPVADAMCSASASANQCSLAVMRPSSPPPP